MKPVVAGSIAAVAVIVAFVAGSFIEFESDGSISIDTAEEGPLETIGEELDKEVDAVTN